MPRLEVRGARDLAELWRGVPAAALRYSPAASTPPPDLADLSDWLRARAWRDHCANGHEATGHPTDDEGLSRDFHANPVPASCADRGRDCPRADLGQCRADVLFPMRLGGGARTWRMATLFLQGWPSTGALHLIALGATAVEEMDWAAGRLGQWPALGTPVRLPVTCFGDLELRQASRYRLRLVTPWVVGKGERDLGLGLGVDLGKAPDAAMVTRELTKSLRSRAHKFTALCSGDHLWQRLGGHLVHHVADTLLPDALRVEEVHLQPATLAPARSRSNANAFQELAWLGEMIISATPALLPWLTLLALCGGGENADKGKGRVELLPMADSPSLSKGDT